MSETGQAAGLRRAPTMADVARGAGVSHRTAAGRPLSGRPDSVARPEPERVVTEPRLIVRGSTTPA
jgi:DNA-binding LacI/PurR family transcriptional regulator